MTAADATRTLRVGCRVFCIDYRPAAVLAKEAATLDLLSDGRLELGLGAGWLRAEYEAMGVRFDPAPVRVARLAETIAAVKAACGGEPLALAGEHVRLAGFAGRPLPVQRPHPPLLVGGGSRRVLELAAREADIVSLNFDNRSGALGPDGVRSGTAEATAKKLAWIGAAAGPRFAALELEIGAYFTFVQDGAAKIADGMGRALGLERDEMLAHPHGLFGSVDAVCEELLRRREAYGISYVTVPDTALESFAPVVARLAGR
jgi:probable F420-dependent oxidoreductase